MKKQKNREKAMFICLIISILSIVMVPIVLVTEFTEPTYSNIAYGIYATFFLIFLVMFISVLIKNKKEDDKYINRQTKTYVKLGIFSLIVALVDIFVIGIAATWLDLRVESLRCEKAINCVKDGKYSKCEALIHHDLNCETDKLNENQFKN